MTQLRHVNLSTSNSNTTLAFLALLGAPYIYEISSLRVNIIKWQVKFNPVA